VTDWTGSGPRTLPAGGTGAHGYDYYEPQGNIQGVGLIYTTTSPTGKMWALCHHDVLGAPTTYSSAATFSTFGILGIQYGANTNGTAVLWANPPKVAGSGVEILKCWGATQDRGPDQSYRVGLMGDYTSVNGDATKIRYAAFAPSVTGGPPPPPPPPANSWTCPSDPPLMASSSRCSRRRPTRSATRRRSARTSSGRSASPAPCPSTPSPRPST
jgi:hypothetical protein